MKVLHITAHLGGGVGKVLSRLVEFSAKRQDGVQHTVAILEAPEKLQFVDHVRRHGGRVEVGADPEQLRRYAESADIVQLEWWHHPALAELLAWGELPAMRLIVWSHVSGLHAPEIPSSFARLPHRFLLSSPCSWQSPGLAALDESDRRRVAVVFSSGGFDDMPPAPVRSGRRPPITGYVGTLNYAKLHPDLLDYLAAVKNPAFRLLVFGDSDAAGPLLADAEARGLAGRLQLKGYVADVAAELRTLDIFAYLLNPLHYGTTENALLEAMAMGVVPVVMNNPAESCLVKHQETGLIVDGPQGFADAIERLSRDHAERLRMSVNAAHDVRKRFSIESTAHQLTDHYRAVLQEPKRPFDFKAVFGTTPADWFLACQGKESWRFSGRPGARKMDRGPHYLYEKTKSSVFHYHHFFPADRRLASWAGRLEAWR